MPETTEIHRTDGQRRLQNKKKMGVEIVMERSNQGLFYIHVGTLKHLMTVEMIPIDYHHQRCPTGKQLIFFLFRWLIFNLDLKILK